jgi:hypothetical protein
MRIRRGIEAAAESVQIEQIRDLFSLAVQANASMCGKKISSSIIRSTGYRKPFFRSGNDPWFCWACSQIASSAIPSECARMK